MYFACSIITVLYSIGHLIDVHLAQLVGHFRDCKRGVIYREFFLNVQNGHFLCHFTYSFLFNGFIGYVSWKMGCEI